MNDRDDALAAARDQTSAMLALAAEVKELHTYGRRNRKFIIFDILLTVALAAVSVVAVHASGSASAAQASAVAARAAAKVAEQDSRNLCESGNVARAQQVQLWDYILGLSSKRPQTAAQKESAAAFEQHLRVIFAPRDCAHPLPGNPGGG